MEPMAEIENVTEVAARRALAKRVGALILEARERAKLKSEELADAIRASRSAVSSWENGRVLPDLLNAARLVQQLPTLSFDELVKGQEEAFGYWIERLQEDDRGERYAFYSGVMPRDRDDEMGLLSQAFEGRIRQIEADYRELRNILERLVPAQDDELKLKHQKRRNHSA